MWTNPFNKKIANININIIYINIYQKKTLRIITNAAFEILHGLYKKSKHTQIPQNINTPRSII